MKNFLIIIMFLFFSNSYANSISVLIPFSPGGTTDKIWKAIENRINNELKSENIVLITEYAQGAGGLVAVNKIKSSTKTVLGFFSSAIAINPYINLNSNYTSSDFIFIGHGGNNKMQVVSRFSSHKEFKEFCKDNRVTYASSGVGSASHFLSEILIRSSDCKNSTHIPYKGLSQIIPDAVTNRIDVFVDFEQPYPNLYGGSLKTFSYQFGVQIWQVLVASKNSDIEKIEKIKKAFNKIKNDEIFVKNLEKTVLISDFSSIKDIEWFKSEFLKFENLTKELNIN